MEASRKYVVISPCRDEAAFMRRTIESMKRQSVLPALWVIVDDGSKDESAAILAEYAKELPWLQVVRREDRGRRSLGPGVIEAFYAGFSTIDVRDFDYVCKLDLDLILPPAYFEGLMRRMEAEPGLGSFSGKPWFVGRDGRLQSEHCGDEASVGMSKFYRRDCFLEIGGFVPHVMWDGIDAHRCRMLGWATRSEDDPELQVVHLRPMGSSDRGLWNGRWRHGAGQWFMGTGLAYMTASALYRTVKPPLLWGSLAMWLGYVASMLARKPRYPDLAFRAVLRRYQRESLLLGKPAAVRRLAARRSALGFARGGQAPSLPSIDLDGVRLHALSENQCVAHVCDSLLAGRGGWIVTPNLDHLRRLRHDESFRDLYRRADVAVADGMPLVWASRLQGTPLPERVAGSDLIWSLARAAAKSGATLFLLGGDPGTADEAAAMLRARFARLRIVGTLCPEPGFESRPGAVDAIAARLAAARPDLVFVALGSPKQEAVIGRLRAVLPRAWWLGVGISFSFVAGRVPRAPLWLRKIGLEWMHRMAHEPRRLARRYLVDGLPFGAGLMARSLLRGMLAVAAGSAA